MRVHIKRCIRIFDITRMFWYVGRCTNIIALIYKYYCVLRWHFPHFSLRQKEKNLHLNCRGKKKNTCSIWTLFCHISLLVKTNKHTPTCPGIQSEDTIYTRVYSVFVQAFKARTNLCITHSKWGHFFTHLWTCLARTKRGLRPYPPTPILWKSEDSAHSHKARTEILTSLCQNVLTLNVKNLFWSSLWMPGRTHPSLAKLTKK